MTPFPRLGVPCSPGPTPAREFHAVLNHPDPTMSLQGRNPQVTSFHGGKVRQGGQFAQRHKPQVESLPRPLWRWPSRHTRKPGCFRNTRKAQARPVLSTSRVANGIFKKNDKKGRESTLGAGEIWWEPKAATVGRGRAHPDTPSCRETPESHFREGT